MMCLRSFILLAACGTAMCQAVNIDTRWASGSTSTRKTCTVEASGVNTTDDAPAIINAFEECGQGGRVVFENTTYYVNSIMNITGLNDVEVDLQGTLLWSTNITYWLNNSLPVGYQNQSSAWFFGGKNIVFDGHGYGTLNGNGDVWYSFASGTSNYPRRPHAITFSELSDSTIKGIRFIRSQMWTMAIIHSTRSLFENIYVNNLSSGGSSSSNTDGADTIYSSFIQFKNWTVINGDDSISMKANSTDITISNCTFQKGQGIAFGSIGQYKDTFETIERVTINDIYYNGTAYAVYFKSWTGDQVGYPPNGGGGGLGFASDIELYNLQVSDIRSSPIALTQCEAYNGASPNCTNSKFQFRDLTFYNISGTSKSTKIASLSCSAVEPCENISIYDVDVEVYSNGTTATEYSCGNVEDTHGFNCTGDACVGVSSSGGC